MKLIKYRRIQQLEIEHNVYEEDKDGYMDNPINQFRLIRRLTSEWSKWEKYLSEEIGDGRFLFSIL